MRRFLPTSGMPPLVTRWRETSHSGLAALALSDSATFEELTAKGLRYGVATSSNRPAI